MKKIDSILPAGYGHFFISITYKRKTYKARSTNTLAIDRYKDDSIPEKAKGNNDCYTRLQAAKALYNEVKRVHNLK